MTHEDLDRMIQRFKEDMPPAPNVLGLFFARHDWRPVWALAKAIQEGFSSGLRYPTHELHQDAWRRFNELRTEASTRAKDEYTWLETKSAQHRSVVLDICKGIGWSPLSDALFFFDKTTVERMKGFQKYLSQAMKELKDRKHEMLGEHKKECFERIQEIKEQHEHFWRVHNDNSQTKRVQYAAREQEYTARKQAFKEKTTENLAKNRERLRNATDAHERFELEVSELRSKIADDEASEKWRSIWSEWLADKKARMKNIEEHIQRLREWIAEDVRKLADME